MSTSQEVKDAADAVATAKEAVEAAETAMNDAIAEAVASIPDEQAAFTAATEVYNVAFTGALAATNYGAALLNFQAATAARDLAVTNLVDAASSYDGS